MSIDIEHYVNELINDVCAIAMSLGGSRCEIASDEVVSHIFKCVKAHIITRLKMNLSSLKLFH